MKWRESPPILAFPASPSSVCLWVTGGEKKGLRVKWASAAMRDSVESRAFYVLADLRLTDSTAEGCQRLRIFVLYPCLCTPLLVFPPSSFIVCLSLIFSFSYSLLWTKFFFYLLNFTCVYFSHCPLFPSLIVPLSFPHFYVSHVGCFSLPSALCLAPLMSRVTDVLPTQKAPLLGLTPARLAHLFAGPLEVSDSSDRSLMLTMATATLGLGPLLWG